MDNLNGQDPDMECEAEMDMEFEDEMEDMEMVLPKWCMEGARTLDEAIACLISYSEHLKDLQIQGYELIEPVDGGHGHLEKSSASTPDLDGLDPQ